MPDDVELDYDEYQRQLQAKAVIEPEEVVSVIQDALAEKPTEYWLETMTEHGFPNGPLNSIDDVVTHEQATARGVVQPYDDPEAGKVLLPGLPINFQGQHQGIPADSIPALGEHNGEVFADLVGDEETYKCWRDQGAFGAD